MPEDVPFRKKDFSTIAATLIADAASGLGGRPALTDATEGSVVLTLMEAFARELAVAYEQLDIVYRYAFLETAEGTALDQVVALLGLERLARGFLVGSVEFSRATPTEADIPIPAGTLVAGLNVPMMQTVRDARLEAGQRAVLVDVQSIERPDRPAPVEPGKLSLMPRPIAGIEQVSNPAAIILRQSGETDEELRARARQTIRGATTGTVDALVRAVHGCGIAQVKVIEDLVARPGEIRLVLGETAIEDEVMQQAHAAVARTRPAGVRVLVGTASPISIRITATLQLDKDYATAERRVIAAQLRDGLKAYFDGLDVGEAVRAAKVRTILGAHPSVQAVADTGAARLMEPVAGTVSLAAKLSTNGDFLPDQAERAVLALDDTWPSLTLESPGVRVDAELRLDPSISPASVRQDFLDNLTQLLDAKSREFQLAESRAAQEGTPPVLELAFGELRRTLTAADTVIKALRFAVVHERTGRVQEMTLAAEKQAPQKDSFAARERPRLGDVAIEAGNG
ncbi:MAG TPA: baseplate J/gp47 family protein [Acetobacteraceae bacterium]|nr:baseplate J/gp47 family protein [Acetobacteraceae bacterium]